MSHRLSWGALRNPMRGVEMTGSFYFTVNKVSTKSQPSASNVFSDFENEYIEFVPLMPKLTSPRSFRKKINLRQNGNAPRRAQEATRQDEKQTPWTFGFWDVFFGETSSGRSGGAASSEAVGVEAVGAGAWLEGEEIVFFQENWKKTKIDKCMEKYVCKVWKHCGYICFFDM